jgi:hypothetical protein
LLTLQSMMLVLPTMPTTLSCSTSLVALAAISCGSTCSSSAMYWIGRPLMPPLSFTQSKYALVMPVIHVKSMPGTLVAMPPILIGSPDAFCPVPAPHWPGFCRLLAPAADPPPEAAVVEAPAAAAVVVAPAVVAAAAVVVAPPPPAAAAVVLDEELLSPPHAASTNAPAPAMTNSGRLMCSSPKADGVPPRQRRHRRDDWQRTTHAGTRQEFRTRVRFANVVVSTFLRSRLRSPPANALVAAER